MSESAETPAVVAVAPPAKAGKMLPILTIVNSAGIAAVLAVVMLKMGNPASAAPAGKAVPAKASGHGEAAPSGHEAAPAGHGEAAPAGHGNTEGGGAENAVGPLVKLPDFVIHLRDSDADRYARMSFEVEVGGEKDKTDLTARIPIIRDVFIAYLSDRTLEELRGSEGLTLTKAALVKKLTGVVPGVRVHGLYITDLVMQ